MYYKLLKFSYICVNIGPSVEKKIYISCQSTKILVNKKFKHNKSPLFSRTFSWRKLKANHSRRNEAATRSDMNDEETSENRQIQVGNKSICVMAKNQVKSENKSLHLLKKKAENRRSSN
eukprot:TRINITY_DN69337_c0_g1_i1.p1 TRINITY_DN69337_c0_g1~~TRINITY_DN69337_c0_g1_i1.p1  ORF type:complete len:119 (+),score=3.44 TRINITY_DN69337_c0_g1_i1:141-497(+)